MDEKAPPLRLEYWHPDQAADNPLNWRGHTRDQGDGLDAVLDRAGWAGAALYNERTGRLIDGHLRKERAIDRGELLPVLIGSWTREQEQLILATLDPLASMALPIADRLAELTALLGDGASGALGAMIAAQKAEANLAELMERLEGEIAGLDREGSGDDGRECGLASGAARVRPVIWIDDLSDFERALMATGEANRGAALAKVCRFYLEYHEGDQAR